MRFIENIYPRGTLVQIGLYTAESIAIKQPLSMSQAKAPKYVDAWDVRRGKSLNRKKEIEMYKRWVENAQKAITTAKNCRYL